MRSFVTLAFYLGLLGGVVRGDVGEGADSRLAALVAELDDARWARREAAGVGLRAVASARLPYLRQAARRAISPEVRVRLRMAARYVFLRDTLRTGGVAFLGVVFDDANARVLVGKRRRGARMLPAARLQAVLLDTAAERAGLRAGDFVVAFGDRPAPEGDFGAGLVRAGIAACRPGDRIALTIVRRRSRVELTVSLGELPPEYAPRHGRWPGDFAIGARGGGEGIEGARRAMARRVSAADVAAAESAFRRFWALASDTRAASRGRAGR